MASRKVIIVEGSRHVTVESEDDPLNHVVSLAIQAWEKTQDDDPGSNKAGFDVGGATSLVVERANVPDYVSKHEGDLFA